MRKNRLSSPRPLSASLSRFSSAAAACAAIAMASAGTAGAATYYWDANGLPADNDIGTGAGLGGAGEWNIATSPVPNAFWFDPLAPASNIVWPNTSPSEDLVVFMGTAGTVSLGAPVLVNALQFGASGFLINNGGDAANSLTLSGATPTISVLTSGHTATISALVAGTQGLTKNGAGTLVLGGGTADTLANTFTGPLVVDAGTLRLDKAAGTLATASTSLQVNGGTFVMGSGSNLLASNQLPANTDVTISGGTFNFHAGTGISAASQTLRSLSISGGTLGTTTGTFTDVSALNTITITDSFNVSGGTPTINSGTTVTAGNFTISGGTLTIGGNTALKKTTLAPATVNLNGGTVQMNYGTATGAQRGEFVLSSDVLVGGTATTTFTRGSTGTATNEPAIILNDAARIFNVADATGSSASDLTLNVRLDNGGFVKTGAGTMTLNATGSQFAGDILVQEGTLAFVGSGNNDQTSLGAGAKTITLTNNATLALVGGTDADPNVASGKGFVIGTGGGTIDVASGRTFFLNDGVANGSFQNQLQGAGTLTKTGAGVLNVGRDYSSTFTGDVNVNLGRLDLTVSNAVGNVGKITVDGSAGAARLNLSNSTAFALTNDVVLQNGAVFSTQSGNHNLANNKTLTVGSGTSRFRVDDGSSATTTATNRTFVMNGALNGAGTLEVTGPSGANRGVLAISNTQSNFSGTIVIDKNATVENYPRFDGTVATSTGKTIGTGTIRFEAVTGGSGSANDGLLDLRDNGTGSNEVLNYGNNVDMTATGGTISVGVAIAGASSNTGNRFVLGSLALGAGNTITVNTTNSYSLEFAGATTLAGDATFAGTSDLTLSGGITGGANIVKNGAGRLIIGAPSAATYSGATTINAGTVVFNSANAIGGTGANVTVASGATVAAGYAINQAFLGRIASSANTNVIALAADSANNLDLAGFTAARLGAVGNATYTGTLTPAGANYLLGGGGGTLTLANANALTGARALDINTNGSAAGTVALAAANNFSGAITVGGGMTLRAASNTSLGSGTAITLDNGTLQFANGGDFTGFSSRTITAAAGGAILDTDGNNISLSTGIGGAGGLTKTGAGTITLTTANTYAGKTIVRGGTLSISALNQLGTVPGSTQADNIQLLNGAMLQVTGDITIPAARGITLVNNAGGGVFDVTGSSTLSVSSTIVGNGAFTKSGTGTMIVTADPNNTGGFTVNGGVLELNHSGSTDGSIVVNTGATLRTFQTVLGDSHNVTVNADGIWDVRSSDQISRLFGDGLVTKGSTGGATVTVNSSSDASFAGVIQNGSGTLGFTKGGSNRVTLTGANTYTGSTQITQGTLAVEGATGALGNTAVTIGDNTGGDEVLNLGQTLDVWTGGELNRIGNTGSLTLNGRVRVNYNGPAEGSTGAYIETLGALNVSNGTNVLTLTPGFNAEVQLSAASLGRSNNGTLLIRGDNLGGTGVGSTRLVSTAAPALIGAGGAAGTATQSIIPWAVGDTSSTGAGTSFVTNGANGLRILTDAEYASIIAGEAGRNVSVAGGETFSGNAAINALRLTGGTTTLAADSKVTVGSGAVLFTGGAGLTGAGTLDFGSSEGIIHVAQNDAPVTAVIGSTITGGNGLTIGSLGTDLGGGYTANMLSLAGSNKFVGNLTITNAIVRLDNSQAVSSINPHTLVMRAGAGLQLGGNNVVVRDLLGNGSNTIQNADVDNGSLTVFSTTNTTFKGQITDGFEGGTLSLVKRGASTFTLDTGVSNFSGSTSVERGILVLSGSGDFTSNGTDGTESIRVSGGGTLQLNNGTNNGDRLRNNAAIALNGGTFDFTHGGSSGTNYSETTGALTLEGGFNTVNVRQAASGNGSALTFASLTRAAGSQAQLNVTSNVTNAVGVDNRSRLVFTEAPTLNDGLIGGWATVNGTDFATYNSTGTISVAVAATTTDAETAWDTTKNVKPAGSVTLTADRVVNSLNFASGQSMDLGGRSLNIDTGGLIHQTSVATDSISNGTLTAGSTAGSDLVIRTSNTAGSLTVGAVIADNAAGAVGLIKSGGGKLVLTGANTYTGPTFVGGTLSIASDSALGTAPASFKADHLKVYDGGTLEVTSGMTLDANRGIQLGGATPTIRVTSGTLTYNGEISIAAGGGSSDLTLLGNFAFGGGVDNIDGGLNVGSHLVGSIPVGTHTVTFAPTSGTLTVGAGAPGLADLNLAYRTSAPAPDSGSTVATLDLQGLDSFSAEVANLRLGVIGSNAGNNATARGELLLPSISNIKVGNGVMIGDSVAAGNGGAQSALRFGSGESSLTTTSIVVGGRKGNGLMTLAAGGTLQLDGFAPNTADLLIAYNNQDATGVTSTGEADFSDGTLVADLDEIVIGFKNGAGGSSGGANGTLKLGASANEIVANQIRLGEFSGGSSGTAAGTLNFGGGSLTVNNDVALGTHSGSTGGAAGTLNITGGSVTVGGNITTTNSTRATATLNLDGGSLDMTSGSINADTFTAQSGTLKNVSQIFNGDGVTAAPLTKSGAGVLAIEGLNTYTGDTMVNSGGVLVNGSIAGSVAVASSATLGGIGSIGGNVNVANGATLGSANALGTLDIAGSLTLADNSSVSLQLNGLTPGDGAGAYGQINTAGSVTLGENVTLSLSLGFAPSTATDTFYFILNRGAGSSGKFANLVEGAQIDLGSGFIGTITYQANWTGDVGTSSFTGGNDIAIAVPEPGTAVTLLGGLGALLGLGRFRRRRF